MQTVTSNRLISNRLIDPADARTWARPHAATDRVLVVLVENGGIDLGLPDLVDRLVSEIPGASTVIPDSMRAAIVSALREWLLRTTDFLIESAELALNRYQAAKPDTYGDVAVLRDSTATFAELKNALFTATRAGKVVDLLILTHGSGDFISADDGIDGARIRTLSTEFGGPLNIRSVYMMNCVGSSLNQAWLDVGARASAGSHANNYLPEPTTYFFFSAWKAGQSFDSAVTGAYRRTIDAINTALREIVRSLLGVAGSFLADRMDVSGLSFIQDSRPEVMGAGHLTIATDTLPAVSTGMSVGARVSRGLVTTVLPAAGHRDVARQASLARSLSAGRVVSATGRDFILRHESPGPELDQRIAAVQGFLDERIAHPLTQAQVDALACFGLGIGARALAQSTVLRLLEAGDFAIVPDEMRKWTKVRRDGAVVDDPQLVARRAAEAELFASAAPDVVPLSREVRDYAHQMNPVLIGGIAVADAIQIGLGAAAIAQAGIQAFPAGNLQVSYDTQQRLLTSDARTEMPGAATPRNTYVRNLFWFPSLQVGLAQALLRITWDGNAYGEIGTPTISKHLDETSDWNHSSCTVSIRAVQRIPVGTDPRTWPLWYHYEGNFNPLGNGEWDFNGDFALDAFGGLAFHQHRNVSRSLIDATISGIDNDSWKCDDVAPVVTTIPDDQMAYLRAHSPA